ncbi:hypothetical protein V8F20_005936 [Naviculisporaceae sp. PSN 640]
MKSSPTQNCFPDVSGATIRLVKGEWDTIGTDPQPRLSVSIPSSQLQPYLAGPPQVQLLSTSTSQYPSAEKLPLRGGARPSSSPTTVGNNVGHVNGDGNDDTARASHGKEESSRNGNTINTKSLEQPKLPEEKPTANPESNATLPKPRRQKRKGPRKPTRKLTTHQIFYITVIDGLGAMILSGAINFAIAYAMYSSHAGNTAAPPILLFHLPNSLAGDAAVTIILQTVITWLVEFFLVRRDIERGGVAPVGFVPIPGSRTGKKSLIKEAETGTEDVKGAGAGYETDMDLEKGNLKDSPGCDGDGENKDKDNGEGEWRLSNSWMSFIRWFCFLNDTDDDDNHPSTAKQQSEPEPDPKDASGRRGTGIANSLSLALIWSQILRALLISIPMFFLLWGPFVGVLMALGRKDATIGAKGDWVFDQRVWLPQVFKLILGGLLALLETPAFAFFWMVKESWDFQAQEQPRQRQLGEIATGVMIGIKAGNGDGLGSGVSMKNGEI